MGRGGIGKRGSQCIGGRSSFGSPGQVCLVSKNLACQAQLGVEKSTDSLGCWNGT